VYTVLYVFLSSVIGLCCKIDYNLEIEVKIMTFELFFIRCGNFLGGSGNVIWEWEGNGNEIQRSWEWELLDGNGRERESKTHSRTPLLCTRATAYIVEHVYYGNIILRGKLPEQKAVTGD